MHERVIELALTHQPAPCSALDLGAGTGALSARLAELGYNVQAADLTSRNYQCPEVPFVTLDLDTDFATALNGPYMLITAVEVIEHLRNPWHFFTQCAKLLIDDGTLIVTTPNIESAESRVKFLATGEFLYFNQVEIAESGHISPLTLIQMQNAARAAGLSVVRRMYNRLGKKFPLRPSTIAAQACASLIRMVAKGNTNGEIHLLVLHKDQTSREIPAYQRG